jgi:hypothetical protein
VLSRLRHHLTYANVVSSLCLFILLGGSAYAATTIGSKQIKNNSILGKDIKNNTVAGKDVKNKSLTSSDFKPGSLPAGAAGPQGARGATGPQGPRAAAAFASVAGDGTLSYGSGVTGIVAGGGVYTVSFDRPVAGCAPLVTQGYNTPAAGSDNFSDPQHVFGVSAASTNAVGVTTKLAGSSGATTSAFFIALFC